MTRFEFKYHTAKYEDVVTAIETLDPGLRARDIQVESLCAQIDALKNTLYYYVWREHCTPDE